MTTHARILSIGLALGACSDSADTVRTVDALAVATEARTYQAGGFIRVSREARKSQHSGDLVNVWVKSAHATEYLRVARADTSTDPDFPEGTMIVKEHVDSGGAMIALTVMYKGPAGSGAQSDDWFWQRLEADGKPSFSGEVDFCIACHTPRRAVDWVYGLEPDNRAEN